MKFKVFSSHFHINEKKRRKKERDPRDVPASYHHSPNCTFRHTQKKEKTGFSSYQIARRRHLPDLPNARCLLASFLDELLVLGRLLLVQARAEARVKVVQRKLTLQLSSPELRGKLLLVLGQHGDVLLGSLSEHTNTVHNANNMEMYFWNLSEHTDTVHSANNMEMYFWDLCQNTQAHSSQCKQHGYVLLESVSEHTDTVHSANNMEMYFWNL